MITQVLIYKERVKGGRIETCEEHSYHDNKIYFLALYTFRQVAVVVLEFLAVYAETCFEDGIVIINCLGQELFGTIVHCRGLKVFFQNIAYGILLFIGSKREYRGYLQFPVVIFLQVVQFLIIEFGSFYTVHSKHSVKAFAASLISMCLYTEILQDILRNLFDSIRMKQEFLIFCCCQFNFVLLGFQILKLWTHIVIINLKFQHFFISYGICDDIRMEFTTKHTGCCLCSQCVCRKYRCTSKSKLIISLKLFLKILLCFTKLRTMTLIKDKDYLLTIDRQ